MAAFVQLSRPSSSTWAPSAGAELPRHRRAEPADLSRRASQSGQGQPGWGRESLVFASALPCLVAPLARRAGPRTGRRQTGSRVQRCSVESAAATSAKPETRFEVGERVECNVEDSWALGVIVRHWYREPQWPKDQVAPYQVKLDNGMTIYCPYDDDDCIRKAVGILSYGKIPVTVLSGFLGAGKTTLLNYILGKQHGKKYAVIENEFGEVPIDEMLLDQYVTDEDSVTVLENGCLCCTMRDDLVRAICDIVAKVEDRIIAGEKDAMIEGILIETTGMADPGPICKTFNTDPLVNATCKIDGILTVVDAAHFLQQLGRERAPDTVNESAQQIAFADKVLLNKVDAVDRERISETVAAIRGINTVAPIVECSLAKKPDAVPIGELLKIDAYDATRLLTEDVDFSADPDAKAADDKHGHGHEEHGHSHSADCADSACKDPCHDHGHEHSAECGDPQCTDPTHETCGHGHGHAHAHKSRHDTDIGTILLEMPGEPLDSERFEAFLSGILAERCVDLYRYKGVLAVEQRGAVARYILQGVHDMAEISYSGEWPPETPVKTQVVMIGRKLDKELWTKLFEACAVNAAEPVDA